jgi:hypothetical protein
MPFEWAEVARTFGRKPDGSPEHRLAEPGAAEPWTGAEPLGSP